MLERIKELMMDAHNENYDKLKALNSTIKENYFTLGDEYLQTLEFAWLHRDREILRFKHWLTFKILKLWR